MSDRIDESIDVQSETDSGDVTAASQTYLVELKKLEEQLQSIHTSVGRLGSIGQAEESTKIADQTEASKDGTCATCRAKSADDNNNKPDEQSSDLRMEVIQLKAELSAKNKEIEFLLKTVESNKISAEAAVNDLKCKYENEKILVEERMKKLNSDLRTLQERAAASAAVLATLVSNNEVRVVELQEQVIRLTSLLSAKQEEIETLRTSMQLKENAAEATINNIKSEYENEKTVVEGRMDQLNRELRILQERAAATAALTYENELKVSELQDEIMKLTSLLSRKQEKMTSLGTLIQLNKNAAEAAMSKYEMEMNIAFTQVFKLKMAIAIVTNSNDATGRRRPTRFRRYENELTHRLAIAEEERETLKQLFLLAQQLKLLMEKFQDSGDDFDLSSTQEEAENRGHEDRDRGRRPQQEKFLHMFEFLFKRPQGHYLDLDEMDR